MPFGKGYQHLVLLAGLNAAAALYVTAIVVRYPALGVPHLLVVLGYFVVFAVASFVAYRVARAFRPEGAAPLLSGVVVAGAFCILLGARPAEFPLLDDLVDDGCLPRLAVIPYAMGDPQGFWVQVSVHAELGLSYHDEQIGRCLTVSDEVERQDCIEWTDLSNATMDYCRRHALRRLEIHRQSASQSLVVAELGSRR